MGGSVPDLSRLGGLAEGHMAQNFRMEVAELLNRDSLTFPGAQPVSFARRHLQELQREDYFLCEKSDGIRSLLYFTEGDRDPTTGAPTEIHYLIDRKNNYYFAPRLHFPMPPAKPTDPIDWGSFYTKTLLDGELLYDTLPSGETVLKYLVFDCLVLGGVNLMGRTLDKRLAYFKEKLYWPYLALLENFPEDTREFPFRIEEKNFEFSYGAGKMFKEILPKLMHGHDGLIFTCRTSPYKFGTDPAILKWKPAEENTVDFKVGLEFPELPHDEADTEPGFDYDVIPRLDLYVFYGNKEYRVYASLFVTADEWERMKDWSIEHDDGLHGQIIECYRDSKGRWRFSRFRDDKAEANHISTVNSVIESIEDGVAEDELIAISGKIRTAWKERAARRADDDKRRAEEEKRRRSLETDKKQPS